MASTTRMRAACLGVALTLTGCGAASSLKNTFLGGGVNGPGSEPERISGFIGGVVADEPNATLAGRDVLALGGNAADAAVAVAFTLAVTYPSRASLGSGGACIAYSPAKTGAGGGVPEAIVFTPQTAGGANPGADRPAAVPMLPRGMFALYARYGRRPFETLVAPAEQLARFGVPASRAFTRDLALVAGPLQADPNARAVFAPGGHVLTEGATMLQPELGATLAQLRVAGVGDLYQGALARRLVTASAQAGGGITIDALRGALPKTVAPIIRRIGRDSVAFLPPPADGGLGAAAATEVLQANPGNTAAAEARSIATVARYRAGGATPAALLANDPGPGTLPPLPASTTFATLDRDGNAVVCALTMDNLFGTGRVAPGTGVVLAASPASVTPPLLAAALAWNPNVRGFRAAVGGSGQEAASLATAFALLNTLRGNSPMPVPVPDPGRANVIACSRYLPDAEGSCGWATDPRGAGLAAGSN